MNIHGRRQRRAIRGKSRLVTQIPVLSRGGGSWGTLSLPLSLSVGGADNSGLSKSSHS